MILFGKAFIAFRSDVKIAFFRFHLFLKECHDTKIPISYLVFMFVLVNPFLLRKNFLGIALWPFIILKKQELKLDRIFINHERIHLRQQIEMLVMPFYVWYIIEYVIRLIQYRDRREAYRNISFEREAYRNEKDLDYLKKRPFWKFITYI
jgi:hypothetical protein